MLFLERSTRQHALVLVFAVLAVGLGGWPQTSPAASGDSPTARCVVVGLQPLPLLKGHVVLTRAAGFTMPQLVVHFRTPALPKPCEGHFRRSVAVSVGLKLRGRPGLLPTGQAHGAVQWLTILRGFKAEGPVRVAGLGHDFGESLPCIERIVGKVRYRVTDADGRLLGRRIAPYRPYFGHCPASAPDGQ
jgi:hypothetical protein